MCLGQESHSNSCGWGRTSQAVPETVEVWEQQKEPNLGQIPLHSLQGTALRGAGPEMLRAVWMGEELDGSKSKGKGFLQASDKTAITIFFTRIGKAFSSKSNLSSKLK